ncbi:unnamed protein product [Calypogeia fissa]
MGKRAKKKIVQSGSPGSRGSRSSPSSSNSTAASSSTVSPSESGRMAENGVAAVDHSTTRCPHGPNVEKIRTQLAKSTVIHCQDCTKLRSAVSAGKEQRKGGKGGKVVRKKQLPTSSGLGDGKKANYKLWICLFCGQVGCGEGNVKIEGELSKHEVKQGAVGRGHAWQHWLQLKHPLVMLCGEEFACWCFSCEVAHEVREVKHDQDVTPESETPTSLESEEEVSLPPSRGILLQEVATLIQEKLGKQLAVVREDSKVPTNGSEDAEKPHSPRGLENSDGQEKPEPPTNTNSNSNTNTDTNARVMKGLVNLGNTCFFNSVMQNLLSVELLRSHFGPGSSLPEGPLTCALRKFFVEASFHSPSEANGQLPEVGLKKNAKGARGGWSSIDGTYNPKGLFGAICSKAPRFKGFQQQDSHELLRCLLDGLHTEEENVLKASLESKSGGGEDALRALSESDARTNGSNTEVDDLEDSGSPRQDAEGTTEKGVDKQKTRPRHETFVERAFGGQLSSTVSCCVCGHSSVVYESFLDLSLPIPSKKQPPKKALANGSSVTQSKIQKAQALKSSKAKAKAESDLDAFRPVPAGLGTPLLLLPPPPPKDSNCDSVNTATEANIDWMDYIDAGTGSGEADWLDFLSDDGVEDSGTVIGCAPNPESQTVQDSAPNLETEIVFGCAPNSVLMQQSSEISLASDGKGILSPPADGSPCCIKTEDRSYCEGADSFSFPNGKVTNQSLDPHLGESFVLLEAAKEAIAESKNPSIVGCGSGLRPLRGQELEMPVQMRGGSETDASNATREAELDSSPVSEPLDDTNICVEQSGDCNDDTSPQSDIISGPNGTTVILLGPPVDHGSASDFVNVELEGEYDGVGSLFEEEDSNEDRVYGPLPLNHSGADFQESSYDGIIFDDVLDLSKISSEERGDWLVSNDEGHVEDNAETPMSLEGCLQTFTRSELLSGENAWACDNCTKKYHEGLANDLKLTAVPEKPVMKIIVTKDGSEQCSNGSSKDPFIEDSISCDGYEDVELGSNGCSSGKGPDFDKSEEIASVSNLETAELEPSVSIEMNGHVNGGEEYHASDVKVLEGCQEGPLENSEIVGTTSSQSSLEPADLQGAVIRSESDTEIKPRDEARTLSGPEVANCSGGVGGDEVGNDKPEAEMNASQLEKIVSQVSTRNSAKTSKLRKSKSKKVQEEQKKVIKQDATKRFLISRAPPVLTIQLKRFAQDMRGRLSKLSGHIAFQELLDLHPFLDQRYVDFDCKYRLIGTVEHSGTLKSGHYVAFVRGPPAQNPRNDTETTSGGASSWYYISDSHVHQTNLDAVLQSEAYLVFYERIDTAGVSLSK